MPCHDTQGQRHDIVDHNNIEIVQCHYTHPNAITLS